jgi:hypothetical protein
MNDSINENFTEYTTGYIYWNPEGYFFVKMKNGSNSTVDSVKESHEIMNRLHPKGDVYILVDAGIGSTSEDDIYEYIATADFAKRVRAQAIIVHELATRLMGNIFLRYIKNKRDIKLFSAQEDALKWLTGLMQKQHQKLSQ